MIPRSLEQVTLTMQPADVTTLTKYCLNLDLNFTLVSERSVSEDLFHVRYRKIKETELFEPLDKTILSCAKFKVTYC